MSNDMPFALIAWIKRQQEQDRKHTERMALKYQQESKEYMRFISFIVHSWSSMTTKEKVLLSNLCNWHTQGFNFSPKQKSVIGGLYMKYYLDEVS